MSPQARIATHVLISGLVQGVWFRGWTVENAQARGVHGWVRNRPDGTVEAVFAGPAALVADLIAACHIGPPTARVERVEQSPTRDEGWTGFSQRASGED